MHMDKPAETRYPVHDLIARRWSPRALEPRPVPAGQIRSLLEAARWAASSFNEQPWSFLVARREDAAEFERMLACLVPANQAWAKNAGVLMLTVAKRTFTRNDRPNRVALHDIGLAAATLTLQATELNLRVHQMGGIDAEKIRETYGIPEGYDPVTAIAIGYPGSLEQLPEGLRAEEQAPRERKLQSEFVFEGSWGRPAAW
jgi:nitroreductase